VFFRSPAWDSVVYWALDLETGGLDVKRDPILAVGMVPIRGGVVRVGESYRTLVRPERAHPLHPDAIVVHQLVPADFAEAPAISQVLPEIEARLRDAVLLVHHRRIDVHFLRRAFKAAGRPWPKPPVVDTAELLKRVGRARNPNATADQLALNLSEARRRFGLPPYQAHDALADAVATAELFLVLTHVLGARTLRHLR
jgi:DNA polymerase III subunit epsilon